MALCSRHAGNRQILGAGEKQGCVTGVLRCLGSLAFYLPFVTGACSCWRSSESFEQGEGLPALLVRAPHGMGRWEGSAFPLWEFQ